jgi:uncharacterized protein involved in response to NO
MKGVPQGLVVETDEMSSASLLRREPYLFLFPAGVLLSWAGVSHWLLHAVGVLADYRPVFHAMVQIQGFLTCFAMGFLFTMIPRRTGSSPPSASLVVLGLAAPLLTALAAWNERWLLSQLPWLVSIVATIFFLVRRFVSATSRRRPPNAFVWIPMALAMGVAGSVMTALSGRLGDRHPWLHGFGRGLLLEGLFLGLVLGVGSLALPLMTRGEAPPDAQASARDRLVRLGHIVGGALIVASFWIGTQISYSAGALLRSAVIFAVLLGGAQIHRPIRPAWNARLIRLAAWMIPFGYLLAGAFPMHFRAGLHLTLVGGFALLALAVSTQVILGHGGEEELMFGRPRAVLGIGACLLTATGLRILMEFDRERYFLWMGCAAAVFLAGTLIWAGFLGPRIVRRLRG